MRWVCTKRVKNFSCKYLHYLIYVKHSFTWKEICNQENKSYFPCTLTWLFDACSCNLLLGFMFKSIILVSILVCPSASDPGVGSRGITWFCCFSPILSLGSGFCPLLLSPGSNACEPGFSAWLDLSPGNCATRRHYYTF